MNCWQIAWEEVKTILSHRPKLLLGMLMTPLLYLTLYGMLFAQHSIDHIPLVIYDEDQSKFSRTLIQDFADSERFRIVAQVVSQEELTDCLREKEAMAVLSIPYRFQADLRKGLSSPLLVEMNASNLMETNMISTTAQDICQDFSKKMGVALLAHNVNLLPMAAEGKIAPVQMEIRTLYNPLLSYQAFFVFGLFTMSFHMALFITSGLSMFMQYKGKKYEHSTKLQILLGKLIPFWVMANIAYATLLLVAVVVFHLPCRAEMDKIFFLANAFFFTMTSLSAVLVRLFNSILSFYQCALALSVPIFMISGFTWPIVHMPFPLQVVARLLPITYMAGNIRSLMLSGHAAHFYRDVGILIGYGSIMFLLALFFYQQEDTEAKSMV